MTPENQRPNIEGKMMVSFDVTALLTAIDSELGEKCMEAIYP